MKVKDFVTALQNWVNKKPENGNAEVMIKIDGETCMSFGAAREASHPGAFYLILVPDEHASQFKMREVQLN